MKSVLIGIVALAIVLGTLFIATGGDSGQSNAPSAPAVDNDAGLNLK